jgi:hypothetical protein
MQDYAEAVQAAREAAETENAYLFMRMSRWDRERGFEDWERRNASNAGNES